MYHPTIQILDFFVEENIFQQKKQKQKRELAIFSMDAVVQPAVTTPKFFPSPPFSLFPTLHFLPLKQTISRKYALPRM